MRDPYNRQFLLVPTGDVDDSKSRIRASDRGLVVYHVFKLQTSRPRKSKNMWM